MSTPTTATAPVASNVAKTPKKESAGVPTTLCPTPVTFHHSPGPTNSFSSRISHSLQHHRSLLSEQALQRAVSLEALLGQQDRTRLRLLAQLHRDRVGCYQGRQNRVI